MRKAIVILLVVLSTACLVVSPQEAAVEEKGAMPRKAALCVNTADFGATPFWTNADQATIARQADSTDAIQAALDAGAGGRVFLPAGAYRVTRPLSMKPGTTFMGAGRGGSLLISDKAMSAVIHLRGVIGPMTVIRDLFFAAPIGGNKECDAIYLEGTNGITVRDCWFGGWRRAVHIQGVSDHWLRNLVFELNQEGIVVSGAQLDPGQQLGPFHGNLRMLDCYGYQNYKGAIRIENLRGAQIEGCSSVGSAYFLWLKNCANVTVSGANVNWDGSPWARFGMRLEGCSLVTVSGCSIDGQPGAALHSLGSRLLTISNNVISNVRSGPGIRLEHSARCTLQGNVISQSLGPAMHLSGTKDVVVAQNVIDGYGVGKGDATARSKHAILCDGESSNCSFLDNVITPQPSAGNPIRVTADARAITIRPATGREDLRREKSTVDEPL